MYYLFITILPANVRVFRYVAKDFASFFSFFSYLLSFSALFTGMKSCLPMLVALLVLTDRHSFFALMDKHLTKRRFIFLNQPFVLTNRRFIFSKRRFAFSLQDCAIAERCFGYSVATNRPPRYSPKNL